MFHNCFEENGFSYDESILDWSDVTLPTNLYKVNLNDKVWCTWIKINWRALFYQTASSIDTDEEENDEINLDEDEDAKTHRKIISKSFDKKSSLEQSDPPKSMVCEVKLKFTKT